MSSSPQQFYKTLNIRGRLISLERPLIMGILNLTPDSFFSYSRINTGNELIERAGAMLSQGADILDIGGQSTRPGSALISAAEEKERLQGVIPSLLAHYPEAIVSIDTFYAEVAKWAIDQGASIVNDISGGSMDSAMFETVARLKVPYILTHMRGTPQTMQDFTQYTNVTLEVTKELSVSVLKLRQLGVNDIIIDPGFGFAKTIEQNYQLLNELEHLQVLDCPILAGVSRKRMIWKTLNIQPDEALNGTTALNMAALLKGASLLRVHDVKEASEVVSIYIKLTKNK